MKILYLLIIVMLVIVILTCVRSTPVIGLEPDWQTLHVVGKFLGSNPPKPDQVFIFKYDIINGTISNIVNTDGSFDAKITGNDSGLFQVQIPRNYPYANYPSHNFNPELLILENGMEMNLHEYKFTSTECYFEYSVPFSGNTEVAVLLTYIPEYNSFPYYGDKVSDQCISETIYQESNSTSSTVPEFPSTIPVLLVSIISLIVFYRMKIR